MTYKEALNLAAIRASVIAVSNPGELPDAYYFWQALAQPTGFKHYTIYRRASDDLDTLSDPNQQLCLKKALDVIFRHNNIVID